MSTYFYLQCLTHDPALQSDTISQHDDLHVVNATRMAQGLPVDPEWVGDYFEQHAQQFLAEHPRCAIGLVTEYGDHRPIPGRGLDRDRAALEQRVIRLEAERSEAHDHLLKVQAELVTAREVLELETKEPAS